MAEIEQKPEEEPDSAEIAEAIEKPVPLDPEVEHELKKDEEIASNIERQIDIEQIKKEAELAHIEL